MLHVNHIVCKIKGQLIDLVVLDFSSFGAVKKGHAGSYQAYFRQTEFHSNLETQTTTAYCQQNKVIMPRFVIPRIDQTCRNSPCVGN